MKNKVLIKILQVMVAAVLVFSLYGCGAQKSARSETSTANQAAKSEGMMMDTATGTAVREEVARPESPNVNTDVGYNRKMIKTGELQLQTKDFKKSVEDIVAKVQSLEGYVENSNIQGSNFYNNYQNTRSASLVVRIPQKHFDAFINQSSEFGNVVYTTSNSTDITSEYVDTEIRLKSLKTRHERLLVLLEQTGSLKDLFTIEQELGQVTYEIEKLSGTLQQYDQLVDMSTINISIEEVFKIEESRPIITFGDKINDTFKESIKGLKRLLEGFVLIIVAVIPFLILIVPSAIIIIVLSKRFKKNSKVKAQRSEEDK
ncbi:DUF4349 domain-containing protein [Cellulosilyticum sp. I15G10I2]|uniref:DUF4349 domain-containing protein n=1 Tax=Cellulosilyticum sp. I15G10I2 TaxID=1892843 RepID=UPI00085C88E8|nr:DUF4349 domain-containing protein [Cellulosilyticum sp. I15G10I2]